MKGHSTKQYNVLLEQMTPLYTLVTVTATDEEDAQDKALAGVEDFQHDRLPDDGVWSIIPPVHIFSPTEDGEPTVIDISEVNGDSGEQPGLSATESIPSDPNGLRFDDAAMQFGPTVDDDHNSLRPVE